MGEVNNDQDRIVIIVGFADRRRALVDEFSGAAVDGKDRDLGVTTVARVLEQRDLRYNKTQDRNGKGGSAYKGLPLVNRENGSKDLQVELRLVRVRNDLYLLFL